MYSHEIVNAIGVGVDEIIRNAQQLGLTWTLIPATTATITGGKSYWPPTNTYVIQDNDTTVTRAISLIGRVFSGTRVMIMHVPPAGNYIIGVIGDVGDRLAYKTLDESIVNSITLQDDNELFIADLTANAVYEMHLYTLFRSTAAGLTPGMKVDFTLPSGANIDNASFTLSSTGAYAITNANGGVTGIRAELFNSVFEETALLIMGSNRGRLQFRWSQDALSAASTTVAQGSYLSLRRVG